MTLPPDAVTRAHTWFAEQRKLAQWLNGVCNAEDAMIRLLEREMRAPTGLNEPDGFPAGGNGGNRGSSTSTTTEAAALAYEDQENGRPAHIEHDTIGPLILSAYDFLEQAGRSARTARMKIEEATKITKNRPQLGRTVTECCEEGCANVAVTTDRSRFPGRCEADRKWLEREETRAEREHRDPVRTVPRDVITQRDNPPKRHEHEPDDDVVTRLVAGYER